MVSEEETYPNPGENCSVFNLNEWANPSTAGTEKQATMFIHLEDRARCPDQQVVNSAFIRILDPHPGEQLLEVGCGSGVLCRLAAGGMELVRKIVGIDISFPFVQSAQGIVEQANLGFKINFSTGAAEALPFADQVFDGAFAARLMLHAADPGIVAKEMVRVVKHSGRVVVMDWDYDTVVVDHSDRELTRRLIHWRTDHRGGDNWSGRKLFRMMAEAGLQDLRLIPVVSIAHSESDSLTQSLGNAAQGARDQAIITPEEYEAWTGELKAAMNAGHFFASINYFIVSGRRR
jgi:ubiquinone/menaquinone biosynthesis C-methylase UbiE